MKKHASKALFVSMLAFASWTCAQDFPTKTVRIITPAAPGGTTDILARLMAGKLTEMYKPQSVIVENRSSATGVVGTDHVAKSDPDGYTLLLAYHQNTVNGALGVPMPYHPVNSFTPITQLTAAPLLLVIHPSSPPNSVQEFIEWAKKKGDVSFGSAGVGSGGHLAGELFKLLAKVKGEHIPYKGTGPALADLMGARYDYNFTGLQSGLVQARAGKLRMLAVTSAKRLEALPDVPAVSEVLPGYEVLGWYGIIGPAKMPAALTKKLNADLVAALKSPDVDKRIRADGSEPVGSSPEAFREFMAADLAKWTKVVKEGGIKVEGLYAGRAASAGPPPQTPSFMFYGLSKEDTERFEQALKVMRSCFSRTYSQDMLITFDRCMGFLEDKSFMTAFNAAAVKPQNSSLLWRLHVLAWAANHGRHLAGDFVECGVFQGFSTAVLAQFLDFSRLPKRWFLYDTFSGIPEHQLNSNANNPGSYQDPGLHAAVVERFSAFPNIRVIRGEVPQILGQEAPQSIAFMHIDMNSADAELGALEQLFHRMVPGSVLVLDDYGSHYYREQKYVEDEFFRQAGYTVLEVPTGQGLVLKR